MSFSRSDLSLALAPFRRRWGTNAVTIALLAIACALTSANVSVFLFLHARPLPYPNADRVVLLGQLEKHQRHAAVADNLTLDNALFLHEHLTGFERLASWTWWRSETLRRGAHTEVVAGSWVTPGFFEILGITPALGATFTDPKAVKQSPRPVILSDALWTRVFSRDREVLGTTLWLNDRAHVVVGVMPANLRLPAYVVGEMPDYWSPLNPEDIPRAEWRSRWYPTIGLRRAAASLASVRAEADVGTVRLKERFPDLMVDRWIVALDLRDWVVGNNRRYFNLLLITTALLSVLIVVNLVNVLVAGVADRGGYFATTRALGASRTQAMHPLVLEHVLAWCAGVALAAPLTLAYQRLLVATLERAGLVLPQFDGWTFPATALLLLALVLAALFVAARLLHGGESGAATRQSTTRVVSARSRSWINGLAISTQSALAVTLLVVCSSLALSINKEAAANRELALVRHQHAFLVLREGKYKTPAEMMRVFLGVKEAVRALPEVANVGLTYYTHPSELTGSYQMIDDLDTFPIADSPKRVIRSAACADYFATAGLHILSGRGFTELDVQQGRRLMVVSRHAAETFWPGKDPIGRRVLVKHRSDDWAEVIGIVQDLDGQRSGAPLPLVWRMATSSVATTVDMLIATRTGAPLSRETFQRAAWSVDPEIAIANFEAVAMFLRKQRWLAEAMARLSALLAIVAAVVCAFGVFSILNRRVGASLKEIALKKALGARPHHVVGGIARRDFAWVAAGVAVGGTLAVFAARPFFGTENLAAHEFVLAPAVAASGVLLGAVLGAAVPAARAVSASLMMVLRNDG